MGASLSRLVDLAVQLEEDTSRAPDVLRRRDRALGQTLAETLGGDARDPEAGVAAWLDRVRPEGVESDGERVERADRVLTAALWLLGAAVGAGAAATLFRYDGSHPVNVVHVLAIFVGLQLALLAFTGVLCLPESWRRFVPGLATVQDGLTMLSPGRWPGALRRWLPGPQRDALARMGGMWLRHRRLYGDVQKWWLLSGSQGFGVAFNVAALAVAFYLVAFTDLAFAWSTTLDVDAATLTRVTGALSRPWSALAPSAIPAPELIAATQYFRADTGHSAGSSAPWWRFLLACMVVYGLLPRLVVLGCARWRLDAAVRTAFQRVPGVAALRDRLESRLVETAGEEEASATAAPAASAHREAGALVAGSRCRALVWAGFPLGDAASATRALGVEVLSLSRAGEATLDEDREAIRALRDAGGDEPVLLIAKAWEPPMLELLDFLAELREALGDGRPVLVVPLSLDGSSAPAAPTARDAVQWQRAADRLGDPWTSVHTIGAGA